MQSSTSFPCVRVNPKVASKAASLVAARLIKMDLLIRSKGLLLLRASDVASLTRSYMKLCEHIYTMPSCYLLVNV